MGFRPAKDSGLTLKKLKDGYDAGFLVPLSYKCDIVTILPPRFVSSTWSRREHRLYPAGAHVNVKGRKIEQELPLLASLTVLHPRLSDSAHQRALPVRG